MPAQLCKVGGAQVQKFDYMTHTVAQRMVLCTAKSGGVATDATAEISPETATLTAGSNEDLLL